MASLNVTLSDGSAQKVETTEADINQQADQLRKGEGPFSGEWVRLAGGEVYVRRSAIIRIEVAQD